MFSRPAHWIVAAFVAAAVLPSSARADTIPPYDLTAVGSSVTIGGTLFQQADPQPTGTGYIDPFLRIQGAPTEAGYNTDGQVQFDTKDKNSPGSGANAYTRSLPLNTLGVVTINGTSYYKFMLDANESSGGKDGQNSLLTMNDFRLYLGNSPSLTGFNDGFGTNSVKIYDMDATSDSQITIDYSNGHGSGSGDLNVFVPVSLFQGPAGYDYVYLYTSFGKPFSSDAGFEEWSAQSGTPVTSVPAPPGLVLAGMGFGCLLLGRLRLRKSQS